jgi:hypothetical protein
MTSFERPKRRSWSEPLSAFTSKLIEPALAKQGFGETSVIIDWPHIVGARVAQWCEPIKLQWPPGGARQAPGAREPATLILRVEGHFALEAQHQAGSIVERVNAHLGWRCIGKIAFRQGPLERRSAAKKRVTAPGAPAMAMAAERAAAIVDAELKEALTRFGARVIETSATGAARREGDR